MLSKKISVYKFKSMIFVIYIIGCANPKSENGLEGLTFDFEKPLSEQRREEDARSKSHRISERSYGYLVENHPAQILGLKIVTLAKGEKGSDLPGRDTASSYNDLTAERNQIYVNSNLRLNKKHEKLFFVWPENTLGDVLTSAYYTLSIKKKGEQWVHQRTPEIASYDPGGKRWFILLSNLYLNRADAQQMQSGQSSTDPHSSPDLTDLPDLPDLNVQQRLTLMLNRSQGQTKYIDVHFRLTGPLPKVEVISQAIESVGQSIHYSLGQANSSFTGNSEEALAILAKSGWMIHQEKILNHHNRPFSLWIKSPNTVLLQTWVEENYLESRRYEVPRGPLQRYFQSETHLTVKPVVVKGEGANEKRTPLNLKGPWFELNIQPNEKFRLEWWVNILPSTQLCVLPEVKHEKIRIETLAHAFAQKFGPLRVTSGSFEEKDVELKWGISGFKLTGGWENEMHLSQMLVVDESMVEEFGMAIAGQGLESKLIRKERLEIAWSLGGVTSALSGEYSCQGVFARR